MTTLQSTITAVTVYLDRARVTRRGQVTLEPGSHRLEISKLPLTLDDASVRASARGTARGRLLGVDVRHAFYVETPAEQVRELEGQVEALGDEIQALDAQSELLKQERGVLEGLAGQTQAFARGLAFGKMTPEAQMTLLDSLRARAEALNAALQDLTVQRRGLERRLEKLQSELKQLRGARARERSAATVEVEVTQAGDLMIELTYLVSDAGWRPLYDMRLVERGQRRRLEIGYLAEVAQRTGEAWSDVALTLSTARPALAETLPELAPWYVGPPESLAPVPGPRASRRAPAAARPLVADLLAGAEPEEAMAVREVETEEAMARVEVSGAILTYPVPGTVTLSDDGAPHKVTIARFGLTPKLDYVTSPKVTEAVYRRAKVTNDSPYTLLPGAASLFAGEEFIGTTLLELVAPQGEIELTLGIDDRVRVKRELTRRDVDKRMMGNRRRLRYGYAITLENLLPDEAKILLYDQIPVARHEDIRVRLESAEPTPTRQTELNLLDWALTLAPGKTRVVRFNFTVEHPLGWSLEGLPFGD